MPNKKVPFFSVIIPAFNRGYTIGQAIQSVLNQTFIDFEIIVVDDGSTDNTKCTVREFTDQRIRYIFRENGGVCSARNLGASQAAGHYLAFLDSDDHVAKDWLELFHNIASLKKSDIIFCNIRRISKGSDIPQIINARNRFENGLTGFFLAGSFCITKEMFDRIGGYDPALSFGENTELGFRLMACTPEIDFTGADSLVYEVSEAGGSQNLQNKIDSTILVLEKHKELISNNKNLEQALVQVIGISYLRTNQFQKARHYLLRAYVLNPVHLKVMLRLMIAYWPILSRRIYQNAG